MPWVNYHTHCHYCDGKAELEAYLIKAIEKGFPACGFSSHAPLPFATTWNMKQESLQDYVAEISRLKEKYRDIIQVYLGLEVDYIDESWSSRNALFGKHSLDYYIGSIHFVDAFPDGTHWSIDGSPDLFFSGFEKIFKNNTQKLVKRYYQLIMEMIENDHPTIIGHLDKIKMHNRHQFFLNEQENWYHACVEDALDLIAYKECIVEINTRSIYRHNQDDLYPGEWILKRIYSKNIPVIINSDAHLTGEIDSGFTHAAAVLKRIGFKTIMVLWNNQWRECAYSVTGIEEKAFSINKWSR
ncbi:MAG: histidinol-phosphatase [Bacteroidales bacterium]|nr:histidinol-phosphatase [Bacteroidales bacterium]